MVCARTALLPAMLLVTVSPFGLRSAVAAEKADAVITWNANAGAAAMKGCMNADASNVRDDAHRDP
jgi:hypothetical protein